MTTWATLLNWRIKTPFYYGWLILAVGALGAFVATAVAGVVLGGVQSFILEDTGWSRSVIGVSASAGVWLSGLFAPFAGRLADRYGPRWLMPLGALTLGVCLFSLGGTTSIWQFMLAMILGRAISQPFLIGVVPRTLAVNFFLRRRNTALALTGVFRPVSGAIIIQLFSAIAITVGWRAAFRYLGVFSMFLALPMFLVMRRRPEDIGLLPDGARATAPEQVGGASSGSRQAGTASPAAVLLEHNWTAREALKTWGFWLVGISTFLGVMGSSGLSFSLVPYLHEEAGLSTPQAAGVLSVSTLLALSSLVWGHLADRITPRWCMVAALISAAGVVIFLFQVNSLVSAYIFGFLWGISHSALEVLVYMVLAGYFGRTSYGAIAGALRPFEAGGLGLGQILGPVIYDVTGSYTPMLLTSATVHVIAAALIFLARKPTRPQEVDEFV